MHLMQAKLLKPIKKTEMTHNYFLVNTLLSPEAIICHFHAKKSLTANTVVVSGSNLK